MYRRRFLDLMPFTTEKIGKALLVRFNCPTVRNPLTSDVIEALHELIDSIACTSVKKLIFTGTGDAFASGADLREIHDLTPEAARAFAERGQSLMNKIDNLPILTISAINGYCFGGGLDLALACDKRVASPNALFSHPGVSLGIITGWGGTQRLPKLIGESNTFEMILTADRFSANEAFRIGLIDNVADDPVQAALKSDGSYP
jgi:enoyl-CoA hydratase